MKTWDNGVMYDTHGLYAGFLHCGTDGIVTCEGMDVRVITWLVYPADYGRGTFNIVCVHIWCSPLFILPKTINAAVSRVFIEVVATLAANAQSQTPGLTSGFQGSLNDNRGSLLWTMYKI